MSRQSCIVRLLVGLIVGSVGFTGLSFVQSASAQNTLGGITGVVTDAQGATMAGASVDAINEETGLKRTQVSGGNGYYSFVDLPIGSYSVTVTHEGFQTDVFPGIAVQAGRTASLNATLTVGAVSTSVTVNASPLMNAVDTTNGYVLDKAQIQSIPLPTGSILGAATLAPGVNAELPPGTGANAGLGNPPIWANGQRDTSNSFSLNGVDVSNLFNGKSTSEVGSARVINSTGVSTSGGGAGVIQSAASIYTSIGNAIPTPAPETIEEVKVNASMYDAEQGSTSGAHIDMSTSTGTNTYHGSVYGRRGSNWINAAPFFFKNDGDVPANLKNPELHRYVAGGTLGGPIIKNKLFGFVSYQHLHVSDQEIGDSFLNVPVGLSDSTRDAADFANIINAQFPDSSRTLTAANVDRTALALFNSPALPGEPGKWLIPNDTASGMLSITHPFDAFLPGVGRFKADMAAANLDYTATLKDNVALKYYYQHDPTLAPYAYSSVPGFTEHLDSGAQVFSVINTYLIKPTLSTTQTIGLLREKTWADNEQPFGPKAIPGGSQGTVSINQFGSNYFPGVSIVNVLGDAGYAADISTGILNIGPNSEGQASNTGVFQNRLMPSGNAIWTLGKHTVSFGVNYSYTQLNTIDKRTGSGTIATDDLSAYAQGYVTPGSASTSFYVSSFLQGNASRYYRANQVGSYVQDKFQVTPTLSLTAGLRYDWDGGLTEKQGRIFNFDPNLYSYNAVSDTIANPGFIIAGNNTNGTAGVSPTTLTGRQWGLGPRVGAAWQPEMFKSKLVVRLGGGMYYDRGELFSYFSPGYAIGTVTGGPFGVNQQLPFVTAQTCPVTSLYSYYIPTCGGLATGGDPFAPPTVSPTAATGNLANPYTNVESAAPTNPKSSDLSKYLPNLAGIDDGASPISLGVYDRTNKLPYTYNYTLDVQWQPRSDLAIELGYVGNLGRHQVIPVPFNQPGIASPTRTIHGEKYSYGYIVGGATLPGGADYDEDYEGGNVDHRVPYIGYAAESIDYKAAGVDAYNALTAHVEKRMSHGLQIAASYTYSHALDEQSGLGLFYNGNNPLNLRDGYASADFDRTHVINFNYVYRLPDFAAKHSFEGDFVNGWSLVGLTVLQSGQPYSVIDFSGAVGSVYYGVSDGITNPIVPLAPGCTAKTAKSGLSGAFGDHALKASCFTLPLLPAGGLGGAIPTSDPFETGFTSGQRNIFRQAFQKRADASIVKTIEFSERYAVKYTLDVYNLTNTTSLDVPGNEVAQNANYNGFPGPASSYPSGIAPSGTTCNTVAGIASAQPNTGNYFYSCPTGLGVVTHTIGSPRQIQMSLSLKF
jgi:Carboxypeptidase regulatory-like domain/TonB dependent receptor